MTVKTKEAYRDEFITLHQGDVLDVLRSLPSASVHCVVTSPPYLGLRNYGIEASVWDAAPDCKHQWSAPVLKNATNHTDKRRWQHTRNGRDEEQPTAKRVAWLRTPVDQGSTCKKCGAWFGCLGLEPTPALFIKHITDIFLEIRRVMRDDAVCFMNMGDSYASNWPCSRRSTIGNGSLENGKREARPPRLGENLKDKDLMGMPWRVAFALQDAGFWLRQDIIWSKPNPMPESVSDRCTKAHEYIFLLTKSAKYFYDAEAIKQPLSPKTLTVHTTPTKGNGTESTGEKLNTWMAANGGRQHPESANKRSVWTIATQPFSEAHFATFPYELPETCIKAGTSEHGCCAACGKPYERIVEKSVARAAYKMPDGWDTGEGAHGAIHREGREKGKPPTRDRTAGNRNGEGESTLDAEVPTTRTLGWKKSCKCESDEAVPCTVLEPFAGSGTSLIVAKKLGRRSIGIELSPEYAKMAARRIERETAMPLFDEPKPF